MPKPRFAVAIFSVVLPALSAGAVWSQDYPNKPIRIVTAAAGGGSDFIARLVAQGIAGPLGQQVIVMNPVTDAGLVTPHVKSGRLRALAVTSAAPTALVPGLPTVAASGLPGYEVVGMTGIFAPGKTPAVIINRLNQEIVRVLNLPDVKERFLNAGVEAVASSPEQFAAIIKSDIASMDQVIKDAGIKLN